MRRSSQDVSKPSIAPLRCAIYTLKSTGEGLDQEFNSVDAQRDAAEAFILSQHREGWIALPELYDDGGFTSANLELAALTRLLQAAVVFEDRSKFGALTARFVPISPRYTLSPSLGGRCVWFTEVPAFIPAPPAGSDSSTPPSISLTGQSISPPRSPTKALSARKSRVASGGIRTFGFYSDNEGGRWPRLFLSDQGALAALHQLPLTSMWPNRKYH